MKEKTEELVLKLERVNYLSHMAGILFGLVCMPLLILAAINNYPKQVTGVSVYAFSFLMVFVCSTLYHYWRKPRTKYVLKIFDHISIYFLIAGTYTPLILLFVNNGFGRTLLIILWSIVAIGIIFKIFLTGKYEAISILLYMVMGWILFIDRHAFFQSMPDEVIFLVCGGGILYSLGVVFYVWEKYTYHHLVWHLFTLVAAICHYLAIYIAVRQVYH